MALAIWQMKPSKLSWINPSHETFCLKTFDHGKRYMRTGFSLSQVQCSNGRLLGNPRGR
ncbi:hypothetical protein BN2475_140027 [Paraburkholderia ribeironis]|uniref:Uncharacterized protein n=1 Tax=Paraburkholderia ribeironis TaxID=1247936 RepID=A0A1N7RST3_9BURK|nr:hypothetical protein BN2475_140027 [Paraburkholderia ribeironis]